MVDSYNLFRGGSKSIQCHCTQIGIDQLKMSEDPELLRRWHRDTHSAWPLRRYYAVLKIIPIDYSASHKNRPEDTLAGR